MKGLMLAGGNGTRLRPISHAMAKQLVPVANKPVLLYGLEAMRDAGITQVGIVVGHHAASIEELVGDGAGLGLHVVYLQQEAPSGLAHAVLIAREFLGEDDFVMYLGDNVVAGGVIRAVGEFRRHRPEALVMVGEVADPREYGVAELADGDGTVAAVREKVPDPPSNLALIGVYVFSPAIHQAVSSISPSWRRELEITDAIQWLIERSGPVRAHIHRGYWQDTGGMDGLLDCNQQILATIEPEVRGKVDDDSRVEGRVIVDEGAHVVRSRLIGPVIVGPGSVVTDSEVGPFTSLGADCVLDHVGIDRSIVLDGSSLRAVGHIRDSVIGRRADVCAAPRRKASQLVVGDDSKVWVEQ